MDSKHFFITKTVVIVAAILALLLVTKPALMWATPVALILGYLFGKATCGVHFERAGIIITVAAFVLVNLAHSVVDGVAFYGIQGITRYVAVYGHELIRQPLLYVILFAMLSPFSLRRGTRWFVAVLAVTGVWFLGYEWGAHAANWTSLLSEAALAQGIYFFIGDIIHHIVDEYQHRNGHHH